MGEGNVSPDCVLSRRRMLKLLTATGATLAAGYGMGVSAVQAAADAMPGCVVRPERTEGPYFVDDQLNRSDIRIEPSDGTTSAGVPLLLGFNVTQIGVGTCAPLPGVAVDVWHCDAQGVYSGVKDGMAGLSTVGRKFLRGYQVTDAGGRARFLTIYPGWYMGRTVHIHFKIRLPETAQQRYEFTSQLYFDDALSDRVLALPPYNDKGERDVTNVTDMHYRNGGNRLLLDLATAGQGYAAVFDIGLDLADAAVGQPDGFRSPGGRPSEAG